MFIVYSFDESKNADKIDTLSNYASGKVLNFAYSGELPKNTTFF